MSLVSLRTPKEGAVASSDKFKWRSLSTRNPEVPIYEDVSSPRLQGIDTAQITVSASTRVAAVRKTVHGDAGQMRGISTDGIRIAASVRELKVYEDFVDDGLREEGVYVAVAGQLQGIDTSAIHISASAKSLIINHDTNNRDTAQLQGIDTSAIAIAANARTALVRTSIDEADGVAEQAPQLQGIDVTGIRIEVKVE